MIPQSPTEPQRPGPPAMPAAQGGAPQPQAQPQGNGGLPPGVQGVNVPANVAGQINPNNPVQKLLLQRVDALQPQDLQALSTGVSPQAAQALKKVFPEIGFLIDMIGSPQGGGGPGGMPQQAGAPGAPGSGPAPQMQPGPGARPVPQPGAPVAQPQPPFPPGRSRLNMMTG